MSLLECKNVTKEFFGFVALDDVSIKIEKGEFIGLIGPNGSGKTTLFNCISGYLKPERGHVTFEGEDITGKSPNGIALKGLIRTFQITRLFREMTVIDNMLAAIQHFQGENIIKSFFRFPSVKEKERAATDKANELLKFFNIIHLKDEKARNLSYGQQKLLSIAMSMMTSPKILLLDEPAAYVNPTLMEEIKKHLKHLNQQGITIFMIEHNMKVLMDICERIYALNSGQLIAEGSPEEIQNDQKVIAAYFGE